MSWKSRSAAVAAAIAILVGARVPLAAACLPDNVDFRSTLLDFNTKVVEDAAHPHGSAIQRDIHAAYDYAFKHCYVMYGAGDIDIEHGKTLAAFAEFESEMFLPGGRSINPMYDDAGATEPLHAGLSAAASGDYMGAETAFRASIAKAGDFQEAHLMLGDLLFAEHHIAAARSEWLAVLESYGPAIPEKENFGPDPPWISALRLYEVHTH
jgi:hypothetical protein